jgi:hypothetical protein
LVLHCLSNQEKDFLDIVFGCIDGDGGMQLHFCAVCWTINASITVSPRRYWFRKLDKLTVRSECLDEEYIGDGCYSGITYDDIVFGNVELIGAKAIDVVKAALWIAATKPLAISDASVSLLDIPEGWF